MSIEDQVRVRVADALRSAGVNEGRVAVEVLYMMPREFVRAYEELWFEIHGTDEMSVSGRGSDDGRALGLDEGKVKEHERAVKREGGREADGKTHGNEAGGLSTRSGYGVGSGKKRYKKNPDGMRVGQGRKSEEALEVKRLVDRKLVRLVGNIKKQVTEVMEASQGESHGTTPGWKRLMENGREACQDCGKLVGRDYVRCPYHFD